jgi:hypothetical protein
MCYIIVCQRIVARRDPIDQGDGLFNGEEGVDKDCVSLAFGNSEKNSTEKHERFCSPVASSQRQKCGLSRDAARAALNELCTNGRIFDCDIPNPQPKRRHFAGWSRTNGNAESQDDHHSPTAEHDDNNPAPGQGSGADQPFQGQGIPPEQTSRTVPFPGQCTTPGLRFSDILPANFRKLRP